MKSKQKKNPRSFPLTKYRKLKRLISSPQIPKYFLSVNNFQKIKKIISSSKRPFKLIIPQSAKKSRTQIISRINELYDKIDIHFSHSGVFNGNYGAEKSVNMTVSDFLEYRGDINLYLAQLPIFERMDLNESFKISKYQRHLGILKKLKEKKNNEVMNLSLPFLKQIQKLLNSNKIEQINVWSSFKQTISEWHYDSYDNFLCVISGVKKLKLLPPKFLSRFFAFENVVGPNYNQIKKIKRKIDKKYIIRCQLKKNEVLFLPQGWLHYVKSIREQGEDMILAINFWFNVLNKNGFLNGKEEYLLKYLLNRKIEKMKVEIIQREIKKLKKPHSDLLKEKEGSSIAHFVKKYGIFSLEFFEPEEIRQYLLGITINNNILENLNNIEMEFITKKLEEIDSKISLNLTSVNENLNLKLLKNQLDEKVENFYNAFWKQNDFEAFLERSMKAKEIFSAKILNRFLKNNDN